MTAVLSVCCHSIIGWLLPGAHAGLCVADVQREQGTVAATDLVFGLQLLREHHSAKACFWTCAFCAASSDSRFAVAKALQQHLQACHEMVQIGADGQPLTCTLCRQPASPSCPCRRCCSQQLRLRQPPTCPVQ